MPAAPAIIAGAQAVSGMIQSNASKNAQKADTAAQGSIDNQLLQLYNAMASISQDIHPAQTLNDAKRFYQGEVAGGLDPAVRTAATANYELEGERGLSALESHLGPSTPNAAGMANDWREAMLSGGVNLQQQLAGMNQGARQQGAAGLVGVGTAALGPLESAAGGLSGLGQQFGQGALWNAQNAQQNNPFGGLATFVANNPGWFKGQYGMPGSTGGLGTGASGAGMPPPTQTAGAPGEGGWTYGA